eukprot:TRINITY_DN12720_c0_g1_i4.p1 TRINITY_DN12720_c0_g1~~TRINITY_DN12720_c0_g1_i4.p1  ORF type:complete len:639 (-),score=172.52 TRINITY_DN12720_c0_g1_i4:101-2017(-)
MEGQTTPFALVIHSPNQPTTALTVTPDLTASKLHSLVEQALGISPHRLECNGFCLDRSETTLGELGIASQAGVQALCRVQGGFWTGEMACKTSLNGKLETFRIPCGFEDTGGELLDEFSERTGIPTNQLLLRHGGREVDEYQAVSHQVGSMSMEVEILWAGREMSAAGMVAAEMTFGRVRVHSGDQAWQLQLHLDTTTLGELKQQLAQMFPVPVERMMLKKRARKPSEEEGGWSEDELAAIAFLSNEMGFERGLVEIALCSADGNVEAAADALAQGLEQVELLSVQDDILLLDLDVTDDSHWECLLMTEIPNAIYLCIEMEGGVPNSGGVGAYASTVRHESANRDNWVSHSESGSRVYVEVPQQSDDAEWECGVCECRNQATLVACPLCDTPRQAQTATSLETLVGLVAAASGVHSDKLRLTHPRGADVAELETFKNGQVLWAIPRQDVTLRILRAVPSDGSLVESNLTLCCSASISELKQMLVTSGWSHDTIQILPTLPTLPDTQLTQRSLADLLAAEPYREHSRIGFEHISDPTQLENSLVNCIAIEVQDVAIRIEGVPVPPQHTVAVQTRLVAFAAAILPHRRDDLVQLLDLVAPGVRSLVRVPILSLIHISEPTRLLSISYAVFCLKKKKKTYR